jgi:hypothetical protein
MNSPCSNGSGRLGELPAALGLLATADIGEESIAESRPVGKAKFPTSFSECHLTGQVGKASLPRRGAKGAKERNQLWKIL